MCTGTLRAHSQMTPGRGLTARQVHVHGYTASTQSDDTRRAHSQMTPGRGLTARQVHPHGLERADPHVSRVLRAAHEHSLARGDDGDALLPGDYKPADSQVVQTLPAQ